MFLIAALLVLMIIGCVAPCATIICVSFTVLFDSHFFCNTFKVIFIKEEVKK